LLLGYPDSNKLALSSSPKRLAVVHFLARMSRALQQHRRIDRAKDLLAGLAVSVVLALALAAAIEAVLFAIGMVLGDAFWHRGWVEAVLKQILAWLEGLPLLGTVVSSLIDPQRGWLPEPGAWRDILILGLPLAVPCYWVGSRIGPTLIARFDEEALRSAPPAQMGLQWAGPLGPVQQAAWAALAAWCQAGTGTGRSPFWNPWVLPDVPERLSLAVLVGENGGGKSHLAEAFARELDRNEELAARSTRLRASAWALKLKVKWNELWWWRPRHPQQPWDCGHLVEDPAALGKLAQFRPRRPTLLVADELGADSLDRAVQWLSAARVDFRHPVRLLFIDVALPSTLALRFDARKLEWHTRTHELGKVEVISLAGARFHATQFRALVGAQPSMAGQAPARLMGKDDEWAPVAAALDEQPILLAEAIRWVREGDFASVGRSLSDFASGRENRNLSRKVARLLMNQRLARVLLGVPQPANLAT
jgi:hypothetical protein